MVKKFGNFFVAMTTVPNAYFSLDVYRKRAIFHMKIFKLKKQLLK
jgi:hypothetical protein